MLSENEDKQSQNAHVKINIFATQKSKARSRVWVVQKKSLHIGETKRTCTKLDGNLAAEMKLHT